MYKEIIKNNFYGFDNLSFIFRADAKDLWSSFLDNLKFGPTSYSNQELDYQELFRKEQNFFDTDLSLIILLKNIPISIFAFTISNDNNKYNISSYGLPILSPLFSDELEDEIKKKLTKKYYELLHEIASHCKIDSWISVEALNENKNISQWHEISLNKGDEVFAIDEGYIDLRKSSNEIDKFYKKKNVFREINQASNLWNVSIKNKVNIDEWNCFKKLHIEVSGKQTRSDKTWDSQLNDINNQKAFVIFLYDVKKLIGGAMYRYTKTTAIYAIGAYDRELYSKPVSHLAHYTAINELKKKNIKWLRMGAIPKRNDYGISSDKEVSIGFFKKKFSTDIFKKYIFIHKKN
mgnify:CR=1 FL=1|jgi:FemAB family protein|tara:strand:- start:333 stop:1376 length:1044 start_codon:yes stop_codon:yes gene_type:complete